MLFALLPLLPAPAFPALASTASALSVATALGQTLLLGVITRDVLRR